MALYTPQVAFSQVQTVSKFQVLKEMRSSLMSLTTAAGRVIPVRDLGVRHSTRAFREESCFPLRRPPEQQLPSGNAASLWERTLSGRIFYPHTLSHFILLRPEQFPSSQARGSHCLQGKSGPNLQTLILTRPKVTQW